MNSSIQTNMLTRLRYNIDDYSPKLKNVANYILSNSDSVQYFTITVLARETATSEATVIRLCRDLGFKRVF